jgi:hypothetical protein
MDKAQAGHRAGPSRLIQAVLDCNLSAPMNESWRNIRKILIRIGLIIALIVLTVGLGIGVLLNWPQLLFGHHIVQGTLELWSDRPFMIASGREILKDVEQRLKKSPLTAGNETRRIFVVNSDWRRRLLFLNRPDAGGLNYFPITSNVFVRPAEIETGRVIGPSGEYAKPPRTLAYYAAHEIAHSLIGEKIGVWRHLFMPAWLNEGLADYIALPGINDREKMVFLLKSDDQSMDPAASGQYRRYRLMVTLALQREHWTLERLLDSRLTQEEAEAELFSGL